MNNARIVDMEIWGGDQNIIEGDPFAVGAENQTCVVVESGEGGVELELELEESFERQGSDGVDVAPDGVGTWERRAGPRRRSGVGEVGKAAQGERSDDGVGAEGLGGWSDHGQESYKE